ncbi:MAG: NAD(P)/FAD-dependent oxidoreductase [Anaerolineales bacterium]|nr:NAD(P)/FAD-dependent oxidoreductase [Anaerolineales bacterium]
MYDVIVIGARCAGSPTAMLLAERGYRVLMVDKATFPSDVISTHIIKYPGVRRLREWGLLEAVLDSGCPPLERFTIHSTGEPVSGLAPPQGEVPSIAPRRTVLDKLLLARALEAGVEFRSGFAVTDVLFEGSRVIGIEGRSESGQIVRECADIVIGADGMNSLLARKVSAEKYNEKPPQAFYYYAYWPDLPVEGLEAHIKRHKFILAFPTNDGLTCLVVGRPMSYFKEFRKNVEANYMALLEEAPRLREAVYGRDPEEGFFGMPVPNYFREPFGPGWALVGDSGLCVDPLQGHGIKDAFRDAELLAEALDEGLSGKAELSQRLAEFESARNEAAREYYEINWKGAQMESSGNNEMRRLRDAVRHSSRLRNLYAGVVAQSVGRDEFFALQEIEAALSD